MDEVYTKYLGSRDKDRKNHEDNSASFEEAAKNEENYVDPEQKNERAQLIAGEKTSDRFRYLLDHNHVVQNESACDQHADRCRCTRAVQRCLVGVAGGDVAIPENGDREGIR